MDDNVNYVDGGGSGGCSHVKLLLKCYLNAIVHPDADEASLTRQSLSFHFITASASAHLHLSLSSRYAASVFAFATAPHSLYFSNACEK